MRGAYYAKAMHGFPVFCFTIKENKTTTKSILSFKSKFPWTFGNYSQGQCFLATSCHSAFIEGTRQHDSPRQRLPCVHIPHPSPPTHTLPTHPKAWKRKENRTPLLQREPLVKKTGSFTTSTHSRNPQSTPSPPGRPMSQVQPLQKGSLPAPTTEKGKAGRSGVRAPLP